MAESWKERVIAYPDSGTPTQITVDESFHYFASIKGYCKAINDEIDSLKHSTKEERNEQIAYISGKLSELGDELKEKKFSAGGNNQAISKLKEKMKIIEPLTGAPGSPEEVLDYVEKVAGYFLGPYKQAVEITKFYGTYIPEITAEIVTTTAEVTKTLDALASATAEIASLPDGSFSDIKISKLKEASNGKFTTIKRFDE